jgi:ATP-dependent DNA helicase RecQ
MTPNQRGSVQEKFLQDDLQVIVATIAFGMGIDKSNVRWVMHYNLPKNIEGYYQEIGRAGRDGSPATAILFYSFADVMSMREMVTKDVPTTAATATSAATRPPPSTVPCWPKRRCRLAPAPSSA